MNRILLNCLLILLIIPGCKKSKDYPDPSHFPTGTVTITTDKACYKPGDDVVFSIDKTLPASTMVSYIRRAKY